MDSALAAGTYQRYAAAYSAPYGALVENGMPEGMP
jgi:hypothetical protein